MLVSAAAWQSAGLADGSSAPLSACLVQDLTDCKPWYHIRHYKSGSV